MTIWNLGSINIDHVYRLDHLVQPGETIAAHSFAQGLGGKGANQSVAAARAGAAVRHIGATGTGDDWVIHQLQGAGIDTTHIARLPDHATGHAIIQLDAAGENAIIIHPGANRALSLPQAVVDAMRAGDTLLIQNETNLQAETAAIARDKGLRVIYSAAPFDVDAVRKMLGLTTILAMNAGEAKAVFAALGQDLPVEGMLVTRGADGADYRNLRSGTITHCPAFPVRPVDTTGAGDCFAGWFAAGLDAGHDIAAALRRASAAAAIQVTRPGASDAMPDTAQVDRFLKDQP
ncbi:MAG: ribokinase [Paracoccus sp. (in: a-proteobacteria)]|uniref:ribokinase n=1 Tax=Paracoccus sp. TaxID=267 RepID=UPI0026DF55AC|nr:ribokinase [Paracoccus sp. (in: a-proteobacteria)]MDO5630544.1 ribokinase [Paracoccus sp. (in: a-proteobacteria)]